MPRRNGFGAYLNRGVGGWSRKSLHFSNLPESKAMPDPITLEALDLAALLCSRVCHDLISPAGAILNGLEVFEEEKTDAETRAFATGLDKQTAKTASPRLPLCPIALCHTRAPTPHAYT